MDSFKLTIEQWERIAAYQGNLCAVCGRRERRVNQRLATDHAHIDGLIRGLLCSQCNVLLGKLENAFIRLGMHKEEGVSLIEVVIGLGAYLRNPPATEALGHSHYGYPGHVGTKTHRKMLKKLAKQKAKSE